MRSERVFVLAELLKRGAPIDENPVTVAGKYCKVVVSGNKKFGIGLFAECEVSLGSSRAPGGASQHSRRVWNSGSHVSDETQEELAA